MQRGIAKISSLLLSGLLVLATSGCGESKADRDSKTMIQDSMEETALREVGTLFLTHLEETKRPPKNLGEFQKNALAFSFGYDWLNRGDLVAFYGVVPSDANSGNILAYEKKVPKEGGFVLMQDGKTVKKISADEFKAVPKAKS